MYRAITALIASTLLLATPAKATTDVYFFYGAGPHSLSSGIDRMARIAHTLRGVGFTGTFDYRDTQAVYDLAVRSPAEHHIILAGYSCGGNSSLAVANALAHNHRAVSVLAAQPSIWCGDYRTSANVVYSQDSYAPCWMTIGLGCETFEGASQRNVLIERPGGHLRADTDPMTQRDILTAIYSIANHRPGPLAAHLRRTTRFIRHDQQGTWLRER